MTGPESGAVGLVVGPSHVARWRWHVRDGVAPSPLDWTGFLGSGGAPVWDASLLQQSVDALKDSERIAVFVGDFRLGNRILLEEREPAGVLSDGYRGISRQAISPAFDNAMLERSLSGLRAWHAEFGDRAQYIAWSLVGRQIHDRLAGRHLTPRPYRHPAFNYDDVVASLPQLNFVDLSPLLQLPMHEVSRLYIDGSSHPSQVGYLLLKGLLFDGLGAREAYGRACSEVESELVSLASQLVEAARRPVVLTGRSVWLDTLSISLGARGTDLLARAGLLVAPLDKQQGRPSIAEITSDVDIATCARVVVSAGGRDLSAALAKAFHTSEAEWEGVHVLDWEGAAEPVIGARGETATFTRIQRDLPASLHSFRPRLEAREVEQGPLGMPSWLGISNTLARLMSSRSAVRRLRGQRAGSESDQGASSGPGSPAPQPSSSRAAYDSSPYLSLKHTTYFPVYDQLFSPYIDAAPTIVEVGVLNGGSLFMWRALFGQNARIIGVDLNPDAVWLRDEGFEIFIGDQSDPAFWDDFFSQVGDVDIFLDDGGHTHAQQVVTAASAIDHIRDGGILVVEDTHTSYMSEFGGPSDTSFVSWAMNLVHGINHRFSAFTGTHNPERRVWSVEFFESIVAFRVDRRLATIESQQTLNSGQGRGAKDYRSRSDLVITDGDLRTYFTH